MTTSQPILHCCDTWQALAAAGTILPNRPKQPETWDAIRGMQEDLLRPLEEHFGVVEISYGFAGSELVKAIKKRAVEGGWHPNITPASDQHAGHELNTRGTRIGKIDGFAVDLRVPNVSSDVVSDWVRAHLPFDAIYLYTPERPFHMSWAREPRGTVIRMVPWNGRLIPRTVVRGSKPVEVRVDARQALQVACSMRTTQRGIGITLAGCATASDSTSKLAGATIELPAGGTTAEALFGEAASRIVVSVEPSKLAAVTAKAKELGVPLHVIGKTGGDRLRVTRGGALIDVDLAMLRDKRERCLEAIVGN